MSVSADRGDPKPKRVRKPKLSPARIALRNTAIVAALRAGREEKQVARDYALTTRMVRIIQAEFNPRSRAYDQSPEEILQGLLAAYEQEIHDYAAVAEDTLDRAPAVSVAAMKGHTESIERYKDLLGRVGMLPGDMTYFRTMAEVGHLVGEVITRLELAAQGQLSIEEVSEYAKDVVTGVRPLYERPIDGTAAPLVPGGSEQGGSDVE